MSRNPAASATARRPAARWRALLWLLATAAVTAWWATQPEVDWTQVPAAAAAYLLLLGAALTPPPRGDQPQ